MQPLSVLSVASEVFPLVKTGGLADVIGALPAALAEQGVAARTLVPGYPAVTEAIEAVQPVRSEADWFGGPARLLAARAAGLDLLVLDAPHLFARPGNPYLGPDGQDWPDNAIRFAALSLMAADICSGGWQSNIPDILHAHDWQTGLAPAYLHYRSGARSGTVMTVHNLAFPGKASRDLLGLLGPAAAVLCRRWCGVAWHHQFAEGRIAVRRSDHHGFADLRGGSLHRRRRHGFRRLAACAGQRAVRDPERSRYRGLGSRPRYVARRPFDRMTLARRAAKQGCITSPAWTGAGGNGAIIRCGQPVDLAERHRPGAGVSSGPARTRCPAGAGWHWGIEHRGRVSRCGSAGAKPDRLRYRI